MPLLPTPGKARRYRSRLEHAPAPVALIAIPVASVMLGSLMTALPVVATAPVLPPFGLLLLLGWRMLVRDLWPVWAPLPLGLFDDILSGQPIGSAAASWTMVFLVIDLFDRRMMWRDYKQDWALAALLVGAALSAGLAIANATGGDTAWPAILPQILLSALVFPLIVRICAGLDRLRWRL
jgi:rod shape-determining protein MreD